MLTLRQVFRSSTRCREFATAASAQHVQTLPSDDIQVFRDRAFRAELPAVLPQHSLRTTPAIRKWYIGDRNGPVELNRTYLTRFGAVQVPLEFSDGTTFARTYHSFHFFLECDYASSAVPIQRQNRYFTPHVPGSRPVSKSKRSNTFFTPTPVASSSKVNIYLAQASIADLPRDLQNDLPTPTIVQQAGKGDVYDSSIWIGRAPTYTPLHRDPNPNLFVQLAGSKTIRMFRPDIGRAIFAKVQEAIGGTASEAMRGEEMMQGKERTLLEHEVWAAGSEYEKLAFEARLGSGDALFIPKGWWHSVKGSGKGINGSVSGVYLAYSILLTISQANWWFR